MLPDLLRGVVESLHVIKLGQMPFKVQMIPGLQIGEEALSLFPGNREPAASGQRGKLVNVVGVVVNLESRIHVTGQLDQRARLEHGGQAAGGRRPGGV